MNRLQTICFYVSCLQFRPISQYTISLISICIKDFRSQIINNLGPKIVYTYLCSQWLIITIAVNRLHMLMAIDQIIWLVLTLEHIEVHFEIWCTMQWQNTSMYGIYKSDVLTLKSEQSVIWIIWHTFFWKVTTWH